MSPTRRLTLIALAAAVVPASAACSASGGATATTASAKTPTKAQYVKDANKICEDLFNPMRSKLDAIDDSDPTAVATAVKDTLLPTEREALAKVRALGYPAGDKAKLEHAYQVTSDELDRMEADPQLALGQGSAEFQHQADILRQYGIDQCAGG